MGHNDQTMFSFLTSTTMRFLVARLRAQFTIHFSQWPFAPNKLRLSPKQIVAPWCWLAFAWMRGLWQSFCGANSGCLVLIIDGAGIVRVGLIRNVNPDFVLRTMRLGFWIVAGASQSRTWREAECAKSWPSKLLSLKRYQIRQACT